MNPTIRKWLPYALISVSAVGVAVYYSLRELAIGGMLGFPLDDSWIHMVFARSIARGDFFAYNPHHPVAGSTTPLWTILLGIVFAVWHNPIVMPKVLGVLLNIVLGILVWKLGERLGLKQFPALMTALLVILSTHIMWASLSGMEVCLYVVLCVASIYTYGKYATDTTWKFFIPWFLAGIAVWARPELALEPVFFVMHQLVLRIHRRRSAATKHLPLASAFIIPWPRLILGGLLFGLCMIPFIALNKWLSNDLLPLTFSAKTTAQGVDSLISAGDYVEIIRRFVVGIFLLFGNAMTSLWLQDNLFLALASCVGLVWIVVAVFRKEVISSSTSMLILLALNIVLYEPIRSVVTGSLDFGQYGRYAEQTAPLMILFGAVWLGRFVEARLKSQVTSGTVMIAFAAVSTILLAVYYSMGSVFGYGHQSLTLGWDVSFLHQGNLTYVFAFAIWAALVSVMAMKALKTMPTTAVLLGFILLQFLGFTLVEDFQIADEYAWNVRNINDTQVLIGKWLHASTPAGTVYATNDIGAMAYYADSNTIIDVVGLVQPEITAALNEFQSGDKTLVWAMDYWKPTYLICFDEWYPIAVPEGRRTGAFERVKTVPIVNNITCGGKGVRAMYVYAVHPEKFGDFVPKFIPQ